MTFDRAWALFLLLLPLAFAITEWRKTGRTIAILLKTLAFIAVVLALAEPRLQIFATKVAVVMLADTSASMTAQDLTRASDFANSVERARGRNWTRVIPFARVTRAADSSEHSRTWTLKQTSGESGRATDLEAGVREAIVELPAGMLPRIVLLSDGKENKGSIARAAWQAAQLGIPIDTVALNGRARPALHLDSVSVPSLTFTGEQFSIDLDVTSPKEARGAVEVIADGKSIGSTPLTLEPGSNRIRAHANLATAGAIDLSVAIKTGELGEVRYDQAMTLRRPRLLYLSDDPAGSESHLMQALNAAQFDVTAAHDFGSLKLDDYQTVVLNNWNLEAIAIPQKDALERYVKQGGGLLVIGGERNIYPDNKKIEDALDRTLPAKVAPPRSPEGTSVVLIIDKSSSMEGRKIELARIAAIGVIDNLRPVDNVGVLIFDNSFQWAVPMRRAEDRTLIKRLIAGITPDGGTQIAPALSEAYRKIRAANGTFKHIVLLTDGISEEGDSLEVSREAVQNKVTISTVGLGQDVNRAYLEKVAALAKGKSYFLNEPTGLEKILLKDVMEHTGTTAIEKSLQPIVVKQTQILEGVGIETAPPLKGYIRFEAKPTAETILNIDREEPLFTRWQYGLGRAAVFTSDAKSRWAEAWIAWPGFDKLWVNIFRDLLPHTQAGQAGIAYDGASGDLIVDYRMSPDVADPANIPGIYVFGPGGFQRPVPVAKVAAGAYRGRVPVGQRQGLFRVRPVAESKTFPEVGLYRSEEEITGYGANELLLKNLASYTGGRFNPEPKQVFDAAGRSLPSSIRLWPGLLAAAVLLNLAEVFLRKWSGVFQRAT